MGLVGFSRDLAVLWQNIVRMFGRCPFFGFLQKLRLAGAVALVAVGVGFLQRVYISLGKPNAPASCNFALLRRFRDRVTFSIGREFPSTTLDL